MKEVFGDLWAYPADWRVITTNGFVRKDGCAVMGRGCAFEAKARFPELPRELARKLLHKGNHVYEFPQYHVITFPVKHHWADRASLQLIERSVAELQRVLDTSMTYVMPRAGCGNGRLDWTDVRPILARLPENVTVIDKREVVV